ncbi:unnamed protein product [Citrullus colocynthis]|uniref:Uncharacterized protein n=1 Tax=Citrullus colocynthis TaxID=252529 RepID=A0ABP0YN07_9ROSI
MALARSSDCYVGSRMRNIPWIGRESGRESAELIRVAQRIIAALEGAAAALSGGATQYSAAFLQFAQQFGDAVAVGGGWLPGEGSSSNGAGGGGSGSFGGGVVLRPPEKPHLRHGSGKVYFTRLRWRVRMNSAFGSQPRRGTHASST